MTHRDYVNTKVRLAHLEIKKKNKWRWIDSKDCVSNKGKKSLNEPLNENTYKKSDS